MRRRRQRPIQPKRMWMVRGPWGLAPYFGVTSTRKEMQHKLDRERSPLIGLRIIRVEVQALDSIEQRAHYRDAHAA